MEVLVVAAKGRYWVATHKYETNNGLARMCLVVSARFSLQLQMQ